MKHASVQGRAYDVGHVVWVPRWHFRVPFAQPKTPILTAARR